jgi:hypothetical protein
MADTQNKEAPNSLLSTQTLRVIDVLCEGPISGFVIKSGVYGSDPLCSTYYDDVPVRNPDGSYNFNVSGQGFSFNYMLGTVSQTGITGFQKIENLLPLSSNTRVANPPQGGGPYKTVVTSFTTNTFPDADSLKVTVRIPALLGQDDNGNTNPYYIEFAVDIATNGGPFVAQPIVPGGTDTVFRIEGKCTQPYLRTYPFDLPKPGGSSFYEWKVRVRRTSPNIILLKTQNELYVDSISVVSTNLFGYPNTAAVATEMSSDQFGSIPARSYEIAGLLLSAPAGYIPTQYPVTGGFVPAAYPEVWDGTFTSNVWTDNPAWVFYDLMTNPVHGLGDYITADYVDKWTLYDIARYCDRSVDDGNGGTEPMFTCNVQIQQPEEAYSVLLNLASTFRGMLYYANGTIHAVQSRDDTPPVFSFTNANVVNGSFSYADSARNTRATVAVVKWVDPDNGYRESVEYIEDVEGILKYGYNEKQMTAFACTSRGQAYRLGKWTLETERLQTETITFQTDLEGTFMRPGDNFAVYDNFRNNRSQGGRILGFQTGRSVVTVDRPVEIGAGITYTLTALIPQFALIGTGDVTGSSQIDLIRNSQTETYQVITSPTSSTSLLTIQGQFNSGLFVGSPFILSASGDTGIFNKASFYTCLATAEIEPGKIEILGLKAPTGVNFRVLTGTPVIDFTYPGSNYPNNGGDQSSILPPTNLFITGETGLLSDNTFYSNIKLTWTDSPSVNLAAYVVSGKAFDEQYVGDTINVGGAVGYKYTHNKTGLYSFKVGALSQGGKHSSYIDGTYLISTLNPFATITSLSGLRISEGYDPLYTWTGAGGYTGYLGKTPTFAWNVPVDVEGDEIPDAQFISGYRLNFKSFDGASTYAGPIDITGSSNVSYKMPVGMIDSFVGGTQRGFKVDLDVFDIDRNYFNGAELNVNNPPLRVPYASGFVNYKGGIMYNVTPSIQYDVSGIFLWNNYSPSFTPTFSNFNFRSTNLGGNANIAPDSGPSHTWFSIVDTFGTNGATIYGPMSGNANDVYNAIDIDITAEIAAAMSGINDAFALITGQVTNSINIISGENQLTLQTVNGLSGQVVGTTPGAANTALNVRVNTAVVNSSGSLSQQIDAVRAITEQTGLALTATVGTVTTALTNTGVALGSTITLTNASLSGAMNTKIGATGAVLLSSMVTADGALSEWITNLGVQTSGQTASVRIGANAFVTGDTNGIGGAAVAAWGFKLNAGNKVVSMQATSESWGAGLTEFGTIAFGGANLQSNDFTAGVTGWQIRYDGSTELNNISARGTMQSYSFTPGSAGWRILYDGTAEFNNTVVRGTFTGGAGSSLAVIGPDGLSVGNAAGDRIQAAAGANRGVLSCYSAENVIVAQIGQQHLGGGVYQGFLNLSDDAGSPKIILNGGGTSYFYKDLHIGDGSNGWLYLDNDTSQLKFGSTSDVNLYRGGANQLKTDDDLVVVGDVDATSFNTTSSIRFKDNIRPLSGVMGLIHSIQGVRFDWKTKDLKDDIGFIAEDVYKVIPTIVGKDIDGLINGLEYGKLTALSIEAIKEIDKRLKELENR